MKMPFVATLLLAMTVVANADQVAGIDGWQVISRAQTGKTPATLCIVRSPVAKGSPYFQVVNGPKPNDAIITVYTPDRLALKEGDRLAHLVFGIDGLNKGKDGKEWSAAAKWSSPPEGGGALWSTLKADKILPSLSRGYRLKAGYVGDQDQGEHVVEVPLTGSGKALAAYKLCLDGG